MDLVMLSVAVVNLLFLSIRGSWRSSFLIIPFIQQQ